MDSIGARLRSERRRLGLSQRDFSMIGGVAANAQGKYELGTRLPRADYLEKLAREGVDVQYVVTGEHRNYSGILEEGSPLHTSAHPQEDFASALFQGLELINVTISRLTDLVDQRDGALRNNTHSDGDSA